MEFDQFKKAIESDAKKENEELKKTIQDLQKHVNQLTIKNKEIPNLEKDLRAMYNRCLVLTGGIFCRNCELHSNFKCSSYPN
jgi:uncharacterized sporulation protein YeaH/YhbH (DUF444 family)